MSDRISVGAGRARNDASAWPDTDQRWPLHPAIPGQLALGSERHRYLAFDYLACVLAATPAERYLDSDNLVARLNLPNMQWTPEQKVDIYAKAIEGLLTLEPNIEKQIKYLDFIDIYTGLNVSERQQYEARYPKENTVMTGLVERFRTEGEQTLLSKLLVRRFGPLDADTEQRLQQATTDELERWAENLLDAQSLAEVFGEG